MDRRRMRVQAGKADAKPLVVNLPDLAGQRSTSTHGAAGLPVTIMRIARPWVA